MNIDIDDRLFEQLGSLARPFVDRTPGDVIARLVEERLAQCKPVQTEFKQKRTKIKPEIVETELTDKKRLEFDGQRAPSLKFAKLLSVTVNGKRERTHWNHLFRDLLDRLPPTTDFSSLMAMKFARGKPPNKSFYYCPQADISVQDQDSNRAWRAITRIATHLGMELRAEVEWELQRKGKARPAYPGKRAHLILKATR